MLSVVLCWSWDAYAGAQQRLDLGRCGLLLVVLLEIENGLQLDLVRNILISSSSRQKKCRFWAHWLSLPVHSLTTLGSNSPRLSSAFQRWFNPNPVISLLLDPSLSLPYFVLVLLSTYSTTEFFRLLTAGWSWEFKWRKSKNRVWPAASCFRCKRTWRKRVTLQIALNLNLLFLLFDYTHCGLCYELLHSSQHPNALLRSKAE